jgi:hypothetical protein
MGGYIIEVNFKHEFYENDQDSLTFLKVYYLEFLVLFLCVYTLLYLNRARKGENYESIENRQTGATTLTLNPLTLSFLRQTKSKFRLSDQNTIYSEETKVFRTMAYLIWSLFSQIVLSLILCKAMVTSPNIVKILVMVCWFTYIITLYRKLAATFIKLEVMSILEMGIFDLLVYVYFDDYFIKNVEADQSKFGYQFTSKMDEHEKIQIKSYFCIILKDIEEVFRACNRYATPIMITLCFLSNFFVIVNSKLDSYLEKNSRPGVLLRYLTSHEPGDAGVTRSELVATQLAAWWLLLDFCVYVVHFFVDNHLLLPVSDHFKDKIIKSLVLRFRFHQLILTQQKDCFPKFIHYKLVQELNEIVEMIQKGLHLEFQSEAMLNKLDNQEQDNQSHSDKESKASKDGSSSNSDSEGKDNDSSKSNSSSGSSSLNDEMFTNFETYEFSPMTPVREKVLFIYYNKNKFALGRGLRSLMFNIPRLSILFMILNLIYTQTAVDYFLTLICLILALQTPKFFLESKFILMMMYSVYFIVNWMIIRLNIPDWLLLKKVIDLLAPTEIPQYSGIILTLGVSIFSFGFLLLILWTQFTLSKLLRIKVDASKIYSLTTSDGYQVLDYKLWKKNSLSYINFGFKMAHTKLLELYALTVFLVCINITGHIYFISLVLLIIFLIVLIDGIKSVKSMLKILKFNTTTIGKQRFVPAVRAIRVICWVAIIYENYNIFKQINIASESLDLSFGVVLIYYLTLTVGDLLESLEYSHNRQKIEKEENIKAGFIALNYAYKINEDKLIKRIHAFIGKAKLDSMGKKSATKKEFDEVTLVLDYNKKLITSSLDDIYEEMFQMIPSTFQRFKRKLIYKVFTFMQKHNNTFRNEDLFVLYQIASKRNGLIRIPEELDLKAYFCNQYKQLEDTLRDIETYYASHKENNETITATVSSKIEGLREHFSKSSVASLQKGKTFTELTKCDWVVQDFFSLIKQMDPGSGSLMAAKNLKAAAEILYKAITVSQGVNLVGVKLDSLKPHLTKKGLIMAKFGNQKLALFNVHEESFSKTHGYVVLKFGSFLSLFWQFCSSNSVVIVFWIIAFLSCINGSAFTILIVGILLFAVLVEETYGNLVWWRVLNILYLLKLILQMLGKKAPGFLYFAMGGSIWIDIIQMVLTNIVIFQHKKTGFDNNHLMKIEDMGSAAVRILVNDDFFGFIDRALGTHQKMCNELATYIERKLAPQVSLDLLRDIKSKCTYLIVKLHHEIDTFKAEANQAAIQLFRRLKEDCYINSSTNSGQFLWRNFSIYSRKPGKDYSLLSYASLGLVLFFSIAFLQYSETGRNTMFVFFSGSQAISSLTVITILIYVTLLFIERCFDNIRTNDSLTIHYHTVFAAISREMFCESGMTKFKLPSQDKIDGSKFSKFRRAVKKAIVLNMIKDSRKDHKIYGYNMMFYKYIFLLILWVLISGLAFIIQPVFADTNRKSLFSKNFSSFMCLGDDINCYSFRTLPITQIFFFLNVIYFFIAIQQIRKGKHQTVPQERNYSNIWELIKHYTFYKTPILREICTLIDYSVQHTSLELSDYLLCEDIRECIINAKMLKKSTLKKSPGKLVPRSQRVFLSWGILFILAILLVLPLLLFSKFTSGNKEQEITEGSFKISLFAGENRFLANLYESSFLMENRKLCKFS